MTAIVKTQNNIDIYNKNKIIELKAIHKFLNSVFGTGSTNTTTSTKKTDTGKKSSKSNSKGDTTEQVQVQ